MSISRLLLAGLFCSIALCESSGFWPPNFSRLRWHSTAVANGFLYVDGGEVFNVSRGDQNFFIFDSTLAFDLSKSWHVKDAQPLWTSKPGGFPLSRRRLLWYNSAKNTLQSWGGYQWKFSNCYAGCNISYQPDGTVIKGPFKGVENTLWELPLPINSADQYAWVESEDQPPWSISINQGSADVFTENTYFNLGGLYAEDYSAAWGNPGLAKLEFTRAAWTNQSLDDAQDIVEYTAYGEAVHVPSYGDKGIIVYLGGYASPTQYFPWGGGSADPLRSLSDVLVYDIATERFGKQSAEGQVPGPRWGFCAVAVEDQDGNGVDIFIHAGSSGNQTSSTPDENYANIYVLSLPSFVWTVVPNSVASMRALHRCEVVGNRQMMVVGGDDPTQDEIGSTVDPWVNGIGVFDMTALKWTDRYDAEANPYQRASFLVRANTENPIARWSEPWLASLFKVRDENGSNAAQGQNTVTYSRGLSSGAIAVLVVCIALALAILVGVFFFVRCARRRRTKALAKDDEPQTELDGDGTARKELDAVNNARAELETAERPQELATSETSVQPRYSGQQSKKVLHEYYGFAPTATQESPAYTTFR